MNRTEILIIAGEASGDRHAADLMQAVRDRLPRVEFTGIGGDEMVNQGARLLYHIDQMAFLGVAEIIQHLPFIRRVFKHLGQWMREHKPQAVILVDYPGFNLRMARMAKKAGFPVIYYICPQLWAWGEKRVEKIRRYVDLPLVIFKFEEEYYLQRGIQAKFVGHPLVDEIHITMSEAEFRRKHGFRSGKPIVALLPGSRKNEIKGLLPVMVQTAKRFSGDHEVEWGIAKAGAINSSFYRELLPEAPKIRLVEGDAYHLIHYAYAALVASGTATLETGYLKTPMVVLYRVSSLTYVIGKKLVKVPNIALANIVCGKRVVPELIQNRVTAENIEKELSSYFWDYDYHRKTQQELSAIKKALGNPGAAQRAAREITNFLQK